MAEQHTVAIKLIVSADGALQTLDRFDAEMTQAANASVKAGKSTDALSAQITRMRTAMEAGVPVLKARAQAFSLEQRTIENAMAKIDAVTRARITAERELSRVVAASSNLVVSGLLSEADAARQVVAVEDAHIGRLRAMEAAAEGAATASARVHGGRAATFQTSNTASQLQDIAVSAQMGMNPLSIALQQGTQLSAIFEQLKQSGQGVGASLVGAFASVVNPLSLVTIAAVALGSVGIQALFGIGKEADKATDALEDHKKWLDEILFGYEAARKAAGLASDAAQKLPQGVVESDLAAKAREQAAAIDAVNTKIQQGSTFLQDNIDRLNSFKASGLMEGIDPSAMNAFQDQLAVLRDLAVTSSSNSRELDAAMTSVRNLAHAAEDPALKGMADDVYELLLQLRTARGELNSTTGALAKMQEQASRGLGIGDALSDLQRLTPDLRTAKQQVQDIFALNAPQARTTSELQALADAAQAAIGAIDKQKAMQDAARSARSREQSPQDKFDVSTANFQQQIDGLRLQQEALSQTAFEATKAKAAFDLLNQAQASGLPITAALRGQVDGLASEYAAATVQLAAMTEAQRLQQEDMKFYKDTFRGLFTDMAHGLRQGEDAWSSMGDAATKAMDRIADRALGMAADGIFDLLFGALSGGFGGGTASGVGGLLAGLLPGHADGTSFAPGGLSIVGERGPELVRLPRGSQVYSNGRSAGTIGSGNVSLHVNVSGARGNAEIEEMARAGAAEVLESWSRWQAPALIRHHASTSLAENG